MKCLTIIYSLIFTMLILCKAEEARGQKLVPVTDNTGKQVGVHSSFKRLSVSQIQSIQNVSIREMTKTGFYGHSTINHDYKPKIINGGRVVVDHSTGLMWHQSGSLDYMKWDKAEGWVNVVNSQRYAGYTDWRLPTVEEAASLLESSRRDSGLYIDPVFDKAQNYIWTGDTGNIYGTKAAWGVSFDYGGVYWSSIKYDIGYVRPVRSGK